MTYSSVGSIVRSRVYGGEVLHSGQWYPGHHEALVTDDEFHAAHRGHIPGRRRGKDVLSGRVRCGLCGRIASVHWAESGPLYRCRHRGEGCRLRARSAFGLERAALLGMRLLSEDHELQDAILREVARAGGAGGAPARADPRTRPGVGDLTEKRRKLLDLFYADRISAEGFAEEEARLSRAMDSAAQLDARERQEHGERQEIAARFGEITAVLGVMDVDALWSVATEGERRELVEELVQAVHVFPDHLEVEITGAPRLNVLLSEVALRVDVQTVGVGGGI